MTTWFVTLVDENENREKEEIANGEWCNREKGEGLQATVSPMPGFYLLPYNYVINWQNLVSCSMMNISMKSKRFVYISTSRLHRNRANLIQTLKTAAAIYGMEKDFVLIMPPHRLKTTVGERLRQLGAPSGLPVSFSTFLHSRWKSLGYLPFLLKNRKMFLQSMVFVRSIRLCLGLLKIGVPHIFEAHELKQLKDEKVLNAIKKGIGFGILKGIVAISHSLKNGLVKMGLPQHVLTVIPSGVDYNSFSRIALPSPEKNGNPRLIHVGTLNSERGANIIAYLAKRYRVLLAGNVDPAIKWPENVQLLGSLPHSKIPSLYEKADVAIIPYQHSLGTVDSFSSLKLLEAMAAGRAIVASNLKPIREVLNHGKEALLVPCDDVNAWDSAIKRIANSHGLCLQLGRQARKKAKEFDWEHRARSLISFCRSAL